MLMSVCLQAVIVAGHYRTVSVQQVSDGPPRLVRIGISPALTTAGAAKAGQIAAAQDQIFVRGDVVLAG
jgi:hypothetical protein